MITIKSLKKDFINNNQRSIIFSGFNLSINKGEKVGLFGPNGSGKTTLLNILSGVDKKFSGSASVEGKRISYVHQDYNSTLLPWFTCESNILLVRKYHGLNIEDGKKLLNRLVKELRIDFSLKKYPFMLSGGQKQIVTLLRALIYEPEILLLDEPFSALDIERRLDIKNFLHSYFSDKLTVILCSHRGDEIKSLVNRAIVLEGTPVKVTSNITMKNSTRKRLGSSPA